MTRVGAARRQALFLALTAVLGSAVARAEEPRVDVVVEEVHASNAGSVVDPPLAPMKQAFANAGLNYTSFRRLSRERITLVKGRAHPLKLANGQAGSLVLAGVSHNSAHVEVSVPPVRTTYTLGREGSVFIQAGPHNGGVLILVLSPVSR